MHPLLNLCNPADIAKKSDIYVSKHIANQTVWDKLVTTTPDHPLLVTPESDAEVAKSVAQINAIKPYLSDTSVLLDYGCGYGRIAHHLLPTVPLAGYVGLDSSYEMLRLFNDRQKRVEDHGTTPVLLLNADTNNPPLLTDSVDVAVVAVVFRHNHKSVVKQSVHELARVVQGGGTVLTFTAFPRMATLMGVQGQLYQIILNLLGRPFKNGPVRYYTRAEIKRLFSSFAKVELTPVGFAVLPHSLLILPQPLQKVWQTLIATPINTLLEKLTPAPLQRYFATHFDVVARR